MYLVMYEFLETTYDVGGLAPSPSREGCPSWHHLPSRGRGGTVALRRDKQGVSSHITIAKRLVKRARTKKEAVMREVACVLPFEKRPARRGYSLLSARSRIMMGHVSGSECGNSSSARNEPTVNG